MSSMIDISELRTGYVLGAPIYDDQNVKLLGQGVQITDTFIRKLRRRGTRSIQVTEEDLAKLRGWKLSVDSPADAKPPGPSEVESKQASRIDQARFSRYLATISQVGRQARTYSSPLRMIRESARLAAAALDAEHYGFGLVFPHTAGISFFLGARSASGQHQKLQRHRLGLPGTKSFMALSMASDSATFVQDLAADDRVRDEVLTKLEIISAAAVPLYRGTLRAGTMAVFYQHGRQLDDHDLSFLETIANIVTVPTEFDVSELEAESEDVDDLTIMMNRRYDYHCWQGIAPLLGDELPLRSSYEEVLCRDISMGGFSFYYPSRPGFNHLAVALGKPPHLKQMKATIVSCSGAELDGQPCALVGCRFAGPLVTN